ncbi:hypothetical protein TNCV_3407421 [Trichonephila clavipes]|nr:hypothetical protein TNCV_3407421 [Trichonephila clavipes]
MQAEKFCVASIQLGSTYDPLWEDPAIVFASAQLLLPYLRTAAVALSQRVQTCSIGERSGDLAGHGRTSYP